MKKETKIYPSNKEYFKKLIPFAKKIISICKDNKIQPIIYGGFAHFFYTKDENIEVNDIDIIIPKKSFQKIVKLLEKNKIKLKYYPQWQTIVIKKGKLKIEIDEVGTGYKTLTEESLSKNIFNKIDFYGTEVKMITLKQLEEIYPVAYNRSREDKQKILKKIKHLEKFLGRKLKEVEMKITIEIIKDKNLPKKYMDIMNKERKKGSPKEVKDFKKDYWPGAKFFFVKGDGKIVAFGGLRDVAIDYLGKKYKILGICNIFSIKKRKGYGKILIQSMVDYLKKTGKTGLGFTGQTEFFEKAGLKSKKSFTWRFALKNPKTGEVKFDNEDCDGIYYNGKDNFIKKVLSTKSTVYYYLPNIDVLHW